MHRKPGMLCYTLWFLHMAMSHKLAVAAVIEVSLLNCVIKSADMGSWRKLGERLLHRRKGPQHGAPNWRE